MQRILLTGLSGAGKSSVIGALAAQGYHAVDVDSDEYSRWAAPEADVPGSPVEPDRDWVWREDRVAALLAREEADVLFVSGCASNMRQFLPQFDHVVLLSAPVSVIVERLRTRTTNAYGKRPEEIARELQLRDDVEPLLRRAADHEIDTSAPLADVVAEVLRLAGPHD